MALAARRFRVRVSGPAVGSRFPAFLAISGDFAAFQFQDRLRLQEGVHNAARYEGFPLDPSTGSLQAFTGRRTQENGGESTEDQSLALGTLLRRVSESRNPAPLFRRNIIMKLSSRFGHNAHVSTPI